MFPSGLHLHIGFHSRFRSMDSLPLQQLSRQHLIRIAALDLGEEKGEKRAGDTTSKEDPEYGGRADVLAQGVEGESGDDRAGLSGGRRESVGECTEAGREDFSGVKLQGKAKVSTEKRCSS